MSVVFPGVEEMRARFFFPHSILMRDDFPTFDLPAKAYSGIFPDGNCLVSAEEVRNSAVRICMKCFDNSKKINRSRVGERNFSVGEIFL